MEVECCNLLYGHIGFILTLGRPEPLLLHLLPRLLIWAYGNHNIAVRGNLGEVVFEAYRGTCATAIAEEQYGKFALLLYRRSHIGRAVEGVVLEATLGGHHSFIWACATILNRHLTECLCRQRADSQKRGCECEKSFHIICAELR